LELLAPAGNWPAFLAAINNGADAVYLGGKEFSARRSAQNFSDEELIKALKYAHLRDKRIFVAVNTLIDNTEMEKVLDYICNIYSWGADAVIIQDLGLLQAVRTLFPQLPIHASTQMTVHNLKGVGFLYEQGIKRIVLARELSSSEIERICRSFPEMEFEVFVHGALCYSYSGQCLFSSLVGGRSGNRGRCAQPCRLPYQLITEKKKTPLKTDGKHLLSPADLSLLDVLPQLGQLGVASLKIEGRMKRPEYVAVVTRVYREALDMISENRLKDTDHLKQRLLKIFNRNFSRGYFHLDKAGFLSTQRPNNRGIYLGRVIDQDKDLMTSIKLRDTLAQGDGIQIWTTNGQGPALTVRHLELKGQLVQSAATGDTVKLRLGARVAANDRVFKIHDQELVADALLTINEQAGEKIPITVEAELLAGQPLVLLFKDEKGHQAEERTASAAVPANTQPLDFDTLHKQIDRLGNTPFYLKDFSFHYHKDLLVPFSEINQARRRAVERLEELILQGYNHPEIKAAEYKAAQNRFLPKPKTTAKGTNLAHPRISVVVSGLEEARAALESEADRVYISLEGISQSRPIKYADLGKLYAQVGPNQELIPALPRIQAVDNKDVDRLTQIGFDRIMAGNLGGLKNCLERGIKTHVDYTLNIFNQAALDFLLASGAKSVCLSPELNFQQLEGFNNYDKIELLVHGELILMVSRFCILGGVLGPGEKNCKGYCRQDRYYIQDQKGYRFPVETDRDCRFYVINSRTLCMVEDLTKILALRPQSIRIEAHRLSSRQIKGILAIYRQACQEINDGDKPDLLEMKNRLERFSPSPFTKCHYYRGVLANE
jgi:putative protease